MTESASVDRDFQGYGGRPPKVVWPGNARIAVQFVLNYEEGGENSVLLGDDASESFLSDIVAAQPIVGARHMSMESLYEYGSRVGVWRILDMFRDRGVPLTLFAVAAAMDAYSAPIEQALKDGHELASHGFRWINYQDVPIDIEREHMLRAIDIHKRITGARPLGWYTGRTSPNSRMLVVEEGGFLYDADDYSDDLPFWSRCVDKKHLIVPYALDTNDMRFVSPQGFNSGEQFFTYLKDAFDVLYEEGERKPKMLSIGLHCRLTGRPGRLAAVKKFIDYCRSYEQVWFARRIDIARHWITHHSEPEHG